jgi:hypothetical protein
MPLVSDRLLLFGCRGRIFSADAGPAAAAPG